MPDLIDDAPSSYLEAREFAEAGDLAVCIPTVKSGRPGVNVVRLPLGRLSDEHLAAALDAKDSTRAAFHVGVSAALRREHGWRIAAYHGRPE